MYVNYNFLLLASVRGGYQKGRALLFFFLCELPSLGDQNLNLTAQIYRKGTFLQPPGVFVLQS